MSRSEPYTERKTCRSCGAKALGPVLDLGVHYLPAFVKQKDLDLPKSPLHLHVCNGCGLLQLLHTVDFSLIHSKYWYKSGINQTMRDALDDVVRSAMRYRDHGVWLDIGANDGTLLSKVPARFDRIACEPCLEFAPNLEEHADVVVTEVFSKAVVPDKCDVITSCAMFYDVDDPNAFVADIASALTSDGIWINQLSDTPTMLQRNAFDNICHEHLCYYDVYHLRDLYARHGLQLTSLSYNDVNGGSIRTTASKMRRPADILGAPAVRVDDITSFVKRTGRWKDMMTSILLDSPWLTKGQIWGYGASTKGAIMLQYLGLSDRFIGIADRNPSKFGTMQAGTWIPVVDETAMRSAHPSAVVVLPWAFREEFIEREKQLRRNGSPLLFPLPNIEVVL